MDPAKKARLKKSGHTFTTVDNFLDLTPAESAIVESRLALADALKAARTAAGLSQEALGNAIGSSQASIARAERADGSVSTDLILRALFGTGATPSDVFNRKLTRRQFVVSDRKPRRASREGQA